MSARIFFLAALGTGLVGGCAGRERSVATGRSPSPAPASTTKPLTPPTTQMTTQTGTLRGGMMAIGGETTGWTLVGDGGVGGLELDVSAVQDAAARLEGKRVNVTGRPIDKQYVERGTVRILRVEKLEEAK